MSGLASKWATDETLVNAAVSQDKKNEDKWNKVITSKKDQPLASKWADGELAKKLPKEVIKEAKKGPLKNQGWNSKDHSKDSKKEFKEKEVKEKEVKEKEFKEKEFHKKEFPKEVSNISLENNPLAAHLGLKGKKFERRRSVTHDSQKVDRPKGPHGEKHTNAYIHTGQVHPQHPHTGQAHPQSGQANPHSGQAHPHTGQANSHTGHAEKSVSFDRYRDKSKSDHWSEKPTSKNTHERSAHPKHERTSQETWAQKSKNIRAPPKANKPESSKPQPNTSEENKIELEMMEMFEKLDSKTIDWTRFDD